MRGVPYIKKQCGNVLGHAWDGRGSFVCELEEGHVGDHQSPITKQRPECVHWQAKGQVKQ